MLELDAHTPFHTATWLIVVRIEAGFINLLSETPQAHYDMLQANLYVRGIESRVKVRIETRQALFFLRLKGFIKIPLT